MCVLLFTIEPFNPPFLLQNPHVQTITAALFRKSSGITFRRTRIDTPDGDFLDIDFPQVDDIQLPDDAPLVLFLHGLEGDARAEYGRVLYRLLAEIGIRSVGMNFRSCGGEMNRTAKLYHLGATGDVALVHDWLDEQFPSVKKAIIGVSLGANLTIKYLGENNNMLKNRLWAAVAISPPFDLTGEQKLATTRTGLFYTGRFLKTLKAKVQSKSSLIQAAGGDVETALAAKNLGDFDDAIIAPLHGFADSDDYYAKSSSINFLPDVQIPTLLIRAEDDPFFDEEDIPHTLIQSHEYLYNGIVKHGGHVGFISGLPVNEKTDWAPCQTIRFLLAML